MAKLLLSFLKSAASARLMALLMAAVCLSQLGCVHRRMTIRSNPPGALVYVDNYEIGTTPVSTDFVYYGTREIRLIKDGYETLTVKQPIPSPWYQYFPIDFFAENVVPGEIRDERVIEFQLQPQVNVPTDELLRRAQDLRQAGQGPTIGPTVVAPQGAAPLQPYETIPAPLPTNTLPAPGYTPYP